METTKRLKTVLRTGFEEIGNFSARKYALLGSTVTGLVFEWSPANEAVLGSVGVTAHEGLGVGGSASDFIMQRLGTGAITGLASFTEQAIVGSLTALSVHQFPKTLETWQKSRPDDARKTVTTGSSATTALALGSSMAIVEKRIINPEANLKEDIALALKTSAIVGGFNFGLATVLSSGLDLIERNGQEQLAHNIENIVKNPLLYVGVFGLAKVIQIIKDKNKN